MHPAESIPSRQPLDVTQAALGLWKELTETASTPSTVLPVSRRTVLQGGRQCPATSVTTDQSAA